jgi:hypothetical protein
MAIRPFTDSNGDLLINGVVLGSQVWDAELAIILLLKMEKHDAALPIIGKPPHDWNPIMPVGNAIFSGEGAVAPQVDPRAKSHGSKPAECMIQVAIPVREALKLGWALAETAQALLRTQPDDTPM